MPQLVQTDPNSVASEDVHLQRLLAAGVEEPWFKSLARNIQEAIRPPKLPPLELTSKPVMSQRCRWGSTEGGASIVVSKDHKVNKGSERRVTTHMLELPL